MTDRPVVANYFRATPEHGNGDKKSKYIMPLERVTSDVLDAVDDENIPVLNHHGVLVWHKDIDDDIPDADDLYTVDDKDSFGRFLKRNFMLVWETGKLPVSPTRPKDLRAPVTTYGELRNDLIAEFDPVESIEMTPHHKPRHDAHYIRGCDTYDVADVDPDDTPALDGLVDMLNPNTPEDKSLMRAMILSAFWGGDYDATPLMVLRAPHGTGSGKTETAKIVSRLAGGATRVPPPTDGRSYSDKIQRDLGTASETIKRVVILDNVETSSGVLQDPALASFITSSRLSLDRLYHGAFQPPNDKVWIMTLNGEKFSRDLADRSVIIDLGPPPEVRSQSDDWDDPIDDFKNAWKQYVDEHRERIITECMAILRGPDRCDLSGVHSDRWSSWAHGVVAKLPDGDDLYRLVQARQGDMDRQTSEARDIVDQIRQKLKVSGIDPDDTSVCIPTDIVVDTLADHFGEHPDGYSARSMWSDLSPYEKTEPFQKYGVKATSGRDTAHEGPRGMVWRGDDTTTKVLRWQDATSDAPIMGSQSSGPDDDNPEAGKRDDISDLIEGM